MKDIRANLLKAYGAKSISAVEKHYGEFRIKALLEDDKWYDVTNDGSLLFTEREAERIVKRFGEPGQKLIYTFIHDSRLWEEPYDEEW